MKTPTDLKKTHNLEKSKQLSRRAHELIPAASHTYSKGDDQFPFLAPAFIERGRGCHVWDVDGNEYIDWGMGLRSVILGHAYPRVIQAVETELRKGSNFTRPSPLELELAELLAGIIPSAEMVKFGKNGSDVTSAAVRLARAHTGRDMIAMARHDPFYSFDDWFIATMPTNAGIPSCENDLAVKFTYGDSNSLENVFRAHPGKIAAVIMEAVRIDPPPPNYLQQVKETTRRNGAVLIFDEIITGFRWHLHGAQKLFGVTPDMSTFGKAFGNGFSICALAGKREIMELGGLHHKKPRVFLLSATHGGETHALAAGIATVKEIRDRNVIEHIWKVGTLLQEGLREAARDLGMERYVRVSGYPCSPYYDLLDDAGSVSLPLRTLFLQETIARGVLMPYVAPSFSHTPEDVEKTMDAIRGALEVCRKALHDGIEKHLVGNTVKPVFRKFN